MLHARLRSWQKENFKCSRLHLNHLMNCFVTPNLLITIRPTNQLSFFLYIVVIVKPIEFYFQLFLSFDSCLATSTKTKKKEKRSKNNWVEWSCVGSINYCFTWQMINCFLLIPTCWNSMWLLQGGQVLVGPPSIKWIDWNQRRQILSFRTNKKFFAILGSLKEDTRLRIQWR